MQSTSNDLKMRMIAADLGAVMQEHHQETDYSPMTISEEIAARPGIFVTTIGGLSTSISRSNVSRLDPNLAKSLLGSIFQQSEKLVLDPVNPTATLTSDHSRNH